MSALDREPVVSAVVQRWDAAIRDVLASLDALLAEAAAASEPLVAETSADLSPLTNPWMAVKSRMHAHTEQVSDGWDTILDELTEALSDVDDSVASDALIDREGAKRDTAVCELELRYARAYGDVMARAAQVMRARALQADAKGHACCKCGAELLEVRPVEAALNVECAYCNAVNTIDPGIALRMFAASGATYLAEQRARGSYEAMRRTETQIDLFRERKDVPLDLLEQHHAAALKYWETRLGAEADLVPEQRPRVPALLEARMKSTLAKLKQHWQWRQRHSG